MSNPVDLPNEHHAVTTVSPYASPFGTSSWLTGGMNSARERVVAFWDDHVSSWLSGADLMPPPLDRWFRSYQGPGLGAVTRDGFTEPYIGDLLGRVGTPRVVVLGLNPGGYSPRFQARDGIFAKEIREAGSYSKWVTTWPYDREPWTAIMGPNRYYRNRLAFTRNWTGDASCSHPELLIFEAYPWHSTAVTGAMRPNGDIIDEFVWQPISELPTPDVFAFGRPWEKLATDLGLPLRERLGVGGLDYGSAVPSRVVRVYELPSSQRLIVAWHSGSAGPPSAKETALLRHALDDRR